MSDKKEKKFKTSKKLLILKGEGRHEHVLEAVEIVHEDTQTLSEVHVGDGGVLTHIDPATGKKGEHNFIPLEKGTWCIGRQVEYSPFDNSISNVFD